jgi:hypothetical protein
LGQSVVTRKSAIAGPAPAFASQPVMVDRGLSGAR